VAENALRVLIVDDEAPARRRLRELLDDCTGALPLAIVGEAQHGREALDLLQTAPAELVLTDIHMPDMDGIELARHLLKLQHPPVVIFTTAFHEHALQAFEVNAVDYLVKPVRVQRLLSALQKVPRLKPVGGSRTRRVDGAPFLSVTERSRRAVPVGDDLPQGRAQVHHRRTRGAVPLEGRSPGSRRTSARFVRVHRNSVAREASGLQAALWATTAMHTGRRLDGVLETLPVSRRQQFALSSAMFRIAAVCKFGSF
jgi:two-component system response regulator AlgR